MKHESNRRNCRKLGPKRLPVAVHGGNWKGIEYLSYREHDLAKRKNLFLSEIKALRAAGSSTC